MKRQHWMIAGLGLVLTLTSTALGQKDAEATFDLRPIWKSGQQSRYRLTQEEKTTIEIVGLAKPQSTTTKMTAEVTWQVTKANKEGGGTATLTIDKLTMSITDRKGNTTVVSATEGEEKARQFVTAMTGSPLTVTIGGNGGVESIQGHEAIQSKAGDQGKNLDADYFKELAMDLAVLFGGKKGVKTGAEWTQDHTSKHRLGKIAAKATYKAAGVEYISKIPVVLINRTADIRFEPKLRDGGPPIDLKTTDTKSTAQIMFDMSRKEVVGANFDHVLQLEISRTVGSRTLRSVYREAANTQLIRISEK